MARLRQTATGRIGGALSEVERVKNARRLAGAQLVDKGQNAAGADGGIELGRECFRAIPGHALGNQSPNRRSVAVNRQAADIALD